MPSKTRESSHRLITYLIIIINIIHYVCLGREGYLVSIWHFEKFVVSFLVSFFWMGVIWGLVMVGKVSIFQKDACHILWRHITLVVEIEQHQVNWFETPNDVPMNLKTVHTSYNDTKKSVLRHIRHIHKQSRTIVCNGRH